MIAPPLPSDELARLAAIEHYRLYGLGREEPFDHAADLAVRTFQVPMSLVSIVGQDTQCFRGAHGLAALSTTREVSFCGHAILSDEVLVVEDALADARFADNPLVTGDPYIRFYAGAPLRLKDGTVPGTLCLLGREPRAFASDERDQLQRLARLVVDIIELRLDGLMAAERHAALSRMKDDFLSTTSHELRTPLSSILGSLALLEAGAARDLPEKGRRLVQIAHANSKRLVKLVNDILDMNRLVAGEMQFEIAPLDVAGVVEEAIRANSGFAAGHKVILAAAPVPPGLTVAADEHRLLQVLTNLVSNAVKFSRPEQTVTVSAVAMGTKIRLSVADTGRGIPDEFRARMFDRFAQADSSDERQKGGTGLGLAIVKQLVTRMGGDVTCESELGKGTTFHVDLPRTG